MKNRKKPYLIFKVSPLSKSKKAKLDRAFSIEIESRRDKFLSKELSKYKDIKFVKDD